MPTLLHRGNVVKCLEARMASDKAIAAFDAEMARVADRHGMFPVEELPMILGSEKLAGDIARTCRTDPRFQEDHLT